MDKRGHPALVGTRACGPSVRNDLMMARLGYTTRGIINNRSKATSRRNIALVQRFAQPFSHHSS